MSANQDFSRQALGGVGEITTLPRLPQNDDLEDRFYKLTESASFSPESREAVKDEVIRLMARLLDDTTETTSPFWQERSQTALAFLNERLEQLGLSKSAQLFGPLGSQTDAGQASPLIRIFSLPEMEYDLAPREFYDACALHEQTHAAGGVSVRSYPSEALGFIFTITKMGVERYDRLGPRNFTSLEEANSCRMEHDFLCSSDYETKHVSQTTNIQRIGRKDRNTLVLAMICSDTFQGTESLDAFLKDSSSIDTFLAGLPVASGTDGKGVLSFEIPLLQYSKGDFSASKGYAAFVASMDEIVPYVVGRSQHFASVNDFYDKLLVEQVSESGTDFLRHLRSAVGLDLFRIISFADLGTSAETNREALYLSIAAAAVALPEQKANLILAALAELILTNHQAVKPCQPRKDEYQPFRAFLNA